MLADFQKKYNFFFILLKRYIYGEGGGVLFKCELVELEQFWFVIKRMYFFDYFFSEIMLSDFQIKYNYFFHAA